jgi:hypothetical protein
MPVLHHDKTLMDFTHLLSVPLELRYSTMWSLEAAGIRVPDSVWLYVETAFRLQEIEDSIKRENGTTHYRRGFWGTLADEEKAEQDISEILRTR